MVEYALDTLRDGVCGETKIVTFILMPQQQIRFPASYVLITGELKQKNHIMFQYTA